MGRDRAYTQADLEFVKTYAGNKPTRWIAEQLGRTPHSVNRRLRENALWRDRARDLDPVANRRHARLLNRRAKEVPEGYRYCRRCSRVLPLGDFGKQKLGKDGINSRCKRCNVETATQWNRVNNDRFRATLRRSSFKRRYGLTPEDHQAFLAKYNNACALCGATAHLRVDHDHNTGRIRGLLCQKCNSALGSLGDSIEGLARALAYLKAVVY